MNLQEYIVKGTRAAAEEFWRYAKAVPEDKADWKPGEGARSVLDMCREIARTPLWADEIFSDKPMDFSEESMAKEMEIMAQWTTIDQCREEFDRNVANFYEVARTMPDERLNHTKFLPFEGGRDFTFLEMLEYPRWNLTYHTGQIAYIQTLYGDREMH